MHAFRRGLSALFLFAGIGCAAVQLGTHCYGQTSRPKATLPNSHSASASKQEIFQFIRGQMLGLSPTDYGKVVEVSFDSSSCATRVIYGDNAQAVINFANLDANSIFWSVVPVNNSSEKFLRLTMIAAPGTSGEDTFFDRNSPTVGSPMNMAIIDFALAKAAQVPDVQDKFARSVKHFITLCGGTAERARF